MVLWSIQLCLTRLPVLQSLASAWYGKELAHSFLRLTDNTGKAVSDLHGMSLELGSGKLAPFALDLKSLRNSFHKVASLDNQRGPLLRVVPVPPRHADNTPVTTVALFKGEQRDALARWNDALAAALDINASRSSYQGVSLRETGQNCHTVTGALCRVMKLQVDWDALPFITNGHTRVLNSESSFRAGNPESILTCEQLEAQRRTMTRDLKQSVKNLALRPDSIAKPELSPSLAPDTAP